MNGSLSPQDFAVCLFICLCVCLSVWPFQDGKGHRDEGDLHGQKRRPEIKTNFGKERKSDKDQPGPVDFGVWLKRSVASSPR